MQGKLTLLALLFSTLFLSAQQRRGIWCFGHKISLDFSSSTPTVSNNSAMVTGEAASSICDEQGNLLFYTNGGGHLLDQGGVWDRNHNLMPNGNLSISNGCSSSSQGALIIPDPKNSNIYYIFTTDCYENNYLNGLSYHKVDMTLNNGLGDVIETNVSVLGNVGESMVGVPHSNGADYWIIINERNSNSFHSILISKTGVKDSVLTNIGLSSGPNGGSQICASPDGSRIGYTLHIESEIMDFDASTGQLSNAIILNEEGNACSFSSNNDVFYVHKSFGSEIYQFDLSATNIPSSKMLIGSINTGILMQLGNDGKIYIVQFGSQYLATIDNPDTMGIGCGLNTLGINVNLSARGSLPNLLHSYNTTFCDSYDTLSIHSVGSYTSPSGNHVWHSSGIYLDSLIDSEGCLKVKEIHLTISPLDLEEQIITKPAFNIFPNPSDGNITLNVLNYSRKIEYEIINATGEIVMANKFYGEENMKLSINLQQLSGTYLLRVKTDKTTENHTLILF